MKKMSTISIGIKNLSRQAARTSVMVVFSFVLTMSLFVSSVFTESMQKSVEKTINRMGADIIVVPEEYETEYTDALFNGALCTFYFDRSWYQPISEVKGVAKATPQLYLASLSASCCAMPLQLIAFDPMTDFIIQPWMQEMNLNQLKEKEVIVGNNVAGDVGDYITFYNTALTIVGKLENTDTTYDNCAFVNFDTARLLMATEEAKQNSIGELEPEFLISTIAIRVDEDADEKTVARTINFGVDDCPAKAYTAGGITSNVTNSVDSFRSFSKVLNILLFIMAILSIVCIFSITILQRNTEFGILLTLGATKKKLISIILTEGLGIGMLGGILGVAASSGVMLAFKDVILEKLAIPAFVTDGVFYGKTAIICIVISLITGFIASVTAIFLVTNKDPLSLIQEENA